MQHKLHTHLSLFFCYSVKKISKSQPGHLGDFLNYFFWFWSVIHQKICLCSPSVCLLVGWEARFIDTHVRAYTWDTPILVPRCSLWRWRLSEGEPHSEQRQDAALPLSPPLFLCVSVRPFMYSVVYYVCIRAWQWFRQLAKQRSKEKQKNTKIETNT